MSFSLGAAPKFTHVPAALPAGSETTMFVDLCTAGNAIDPNTQVHIRKALTIMTSPKNLYYDMHGLKCQGNHQHQQIEGNCQYHGKNINKSTFSENYPRKFARRVAKNLCRAQVPRELPDRRVKDQCLWNWTLAGVTPWSTMRKTR